MNVDTTTERTVGTRDEWRAARVRLLESEKELTRRSDELARQRQELPWVPVDKEYVFDTEDGPATLADLFRGRSQLIVQHFMFPPSWDAGCPSCSSMVDGWAGSRVHLENHDVALTAISRAPLDKLLAYRDRMGWDIPWASSSDNTFNVDFGVSFAESQLADGTAEYNFRAIPVEASELPHDGNSDEPIDDAESPGISTFALKEGRCSTPTRPTPAASMGCGACTSGSTGPRSGATRTACGSAVTTSTGRNDMAGIDVIAHVSGVPIEEAVPLVLATGATASLGLRMAWQRLVDRRRRAHSPR